MAITYTASYNYYISHCCSSMCYSSYRTKYCYTITTTIATTITTLTTITITTINNTTNTSLANCMTESCPY